MTYQMAIDDIYGILRKLITEQSLALIGEVPRIHWHGLEMDGTPDRGKFFVRVSHEDTDSNQATLRGCEAGSRLRTTGFLKVQIYCPFTVKGSASKGRALAVLLRNNYFTKQSQNGVWFREPRISDRPVERDWFQLVLTVQYTFDEIVQ